MSRGQSNELFGRLQDPVMFIVLEHLNPSIGIGLTWACVFIFGRIGVRLSGIPPKESGDFSQRTDSPIRILHTRAESLMIVEHLYRDFRALLRYRLAKLNERRRFPWLSI